jgi:hypothetical protein
MQKIKFITGFSCFGGSTIALIEHCKLLDSIGFDVEFYGECDWHISQYNKSKLLKDLKIDQNDILIYHYKELSDRPCCKLCLLYIHERTLFDLKSRDVSGFDAFIFLNEDHKNFHKRDGFIIPNPILNLIDKSQNNPPNKNIAGVVGTIQSRKQQKISIIKALEDGCSKVLLFGDKENNYFEKEIRPLLGEKVEYKGFYDPSKRMEMYNQFDFLYHFSEDESASLTVGECELLKKPVFKSKNISSYKAITNFEIASMWRRALMQEKVDKLVCVVTYNRKECIAKWLRAWNNADKYGAKIAVLHSCDNESPKEDEKENILKYNPDFYIPFKNTEWRDMQALVHLSKEEFGLPEFEYLFWFTDDMLPMRKEFFKPFAEKITKPHVGIVAQCYEPKSITAGPHIRTVAYALKREVFQKLIFPNSQNKKEDPLLFEHGKRGVFENHIMNQVLEMGFGLELCHSSPESENYQHWTSFLDWMWDCHLLSHWKEYEQLYEEQFNSVQKFENVRTNKQLLITPDQFDEFSLVKDKICAVVPTADAPIEYLIWALFSLLIRSNDSLDHIIVAINGPDSRTGNTERQDLKQKFLEELRLLKFRNRDMPLTLIRTWSRIGHSQTIDQCIPWAHTEFYLSMHDDVIILNDKWCHRLDEFKDEKLICLTYGDSVQKGLVSREDNILELPHFNSVFTLCKKSRMKKINAEWSGKYATFDFYIDNLYSYNQFIEWHRKNNFLDESNLPKKDCKYKAISIDIGGSFIPDIIKNNFEIRKFDSNSIKHFISKSWCHDKEIIQFSKETLDLEKEIKNIPDFWNLYQKYINPQISKKSFG